MTTAEALAEYVTGDSSELFDRLRVLREWRSRLDDFHGLAGLLDRAQFWLMEELERRAVKVEEIMTDTPDTDLQAAPVMLPQRLTRTIDARIRRPVRLGRTIRRGL